MLTRNTGVSHQVTLCEEEIFDVSLATFYVFDKENAGTFRRGVRLAAGGCGCVRLRLQRWLRQASRRAHRLRSVDAREQC